MFCGKGTGGRFLRFVVRICVEHWSLCEGLVHSRSVWSGISICGCIIADRTYSKFGLCIVAREPVSKFVFWGRWLCWQSWVNGTMQGNRWEDAAVVQKSDVSGNSSYNGGRDVCCEGRICIKSPQHIGITELYIFKMIVIKISSWNEIGKREKYSFPGVWMSLEFVLAFTFLIELALNSKFEYSVKNFFVVEFHRTGLGWWY